MILKHQSCHKNQIILFSAFIWLMIFSPPVFCEELVRDASEYERSVLNLTITKAVPDQESPWATQNQDLTGVSGIVVGENRILTLASNISRAVFIQAQKVDDFEKIPLKVEFADYDANLAILKPIDGARLIGVKTLPIGPDLPIGNDVWLVSIENDKQLQRIPMRIMEVGIREAVVSGITLPMYALSGSNRSSCKSDPIIRKGALVGVCAGVVEGQPQVITSGMIGHFLHDAISGKDYRGFGTVGVSFEAVKSPWYRKLLKVPKGQGALRVSTIFENSMFVDCVAVDDVVLGFDQVKVDHRGFFNHVQWGPISVRNYIATKFAGDAVTIHFTRQGMQKSCTRPLRRYTSADNYIPGPLHDGPVPHLIFGGLVFRELNADYLTMFGRDWLRNAPAKFGFIYMYENVPKLTRERVIILSHVLSDSINAGYERLDNLVLKSVNGQPVTSLEDLRIKLRLPGISREGEEFAEFNFQSHQQIVIPYGVLESSHKRIAKVYSVGNKTSFFSR